MAGIGGNGHVLNFAQSLRWFFCISIWISQNSMLLRNDIVYLSALTKLFCFVKAIIWNEIWVEIREISRFPSFTKHRKFRKISLTSSHSFFHQFDYFLFLSCFSMDLIILFLPLIWVYLTYSICRSAHISLYASWAVISHMLFIPLQQINLFMFSFKHIIHWCLFPYSFSSFPPHFDYRSNTFHPWPYSTPNTRSLSSFLLVLTLLYIYSYLFVCIITWILRIRCPYSIHVIQPPAL